MKNGFTLKVDTSKKGIDAVFKSYQYEIVNILLEANVEHSSNEMTTRLHLRGFDISRASVINFLERLSTAGLAMKREESSKGGYKGIYKIAETKQDFNARIVDIFLAKLHEAFPAFKFSVVESIN